MEQPGPRTIAVTYRSHSRLARIRLIQPGPRRPWLARLTDRRAPADIPEPDPPYNPELALELLANTRELPGTRHDLEIVLTHYRHALHQIATQALTTQATPATTGHHQPCHHR